MNTFIYNYANGSVIICTQ